MQLLVKFTREHLLYLSGLHCHLILVIILVAKTITTVVVALLLTVAAVCVFFFFLLLFCFFTYYNRLIQKYWFFKLSKSKLSATGSCADLIYELYIVLCMVISESGISKTFFGLLEFFCHRNSMLLSWHTLIYCKLTSRTVES